MAYHFPVVWNGTSHLLDGTSASAPTFAAIIALINDALLAEGRPSLGFLNPWLYSSALPGLRDVTIGSNRGCGTMGFPAVEGWDAATGLGTPWFPVLKHLALRDAFRWDHPWYVADLA
ncbi:tripeptidyl-peptidase [Colletotrichum higginsianum]|nr:tripeptidyl-peptidase [Colletotrichum higginsianum]